MIQLHDQNEAAEVFGGRPTARVLVTCEHASQRLPEGFRWSERDRRLVDTHWAIDLGARDLAMELSAHLDAVMIASTFSRLLVDPNRPETSATLFRDAADGEPVELNTAISSEERMHRIERFLRPYHAMVDRHVAASKAELLLSVHSFTPVYEGQRRSLEIGVLFDRDERLARTLESGLRRAGYHTALNEPYSGKLGLMYSVDRHARAHGRAAVELEVRQDLAVDPGFRAQLVRTLGDLLL